MTVILIWELDMSIKFLWVVPLRPLLIINSKLQPRRPVLPMITCKFRLFHNCKNGPTFSFILRTRDQFTSVQKGFLWRRDLVFIGIEEENFTFALVSIISRWTSLLICLGYVSITSLCLQLSAICFQQHRFLCSKGTGVIFPGLECFQFQIWECWRAASAVLQV